MSRSAEVIRETRETKIRLVLNVDGTGRSDVKTGIGFFDHMLDSFARHSGMDVNVRAEGDLHVDEHHTVEDVGICFGETLKKALGDKRGVSRFGWALCPMDEALAQASLDLSGRGLFAGGMPLAGLRIGGMDGPTLLEFFKGAALSGGITLHLDLVRGENGHHMAEAAFKAFARALRMAAAIDGSDVPSTKGVL
jgi:imidazoleglycerol-phosphate dehydratase